jgi:hypothetical protein
VGGGRWAGAVRFVLLLLMMMTMIIDDDDLSRAFCHVSYVLSARIATLGGFKVQDI